MMDRRQQSRRPEFPVGSADPDQIAELTSLEIGFEDDGTVVVSWSGDEDWSTGFVTVGLGSAPSDPTSGTNDGDLVGQNGALVLDGAGSTTLRQATIGQMVFVRVLPETGAAVAGTFQRRRGDTEFVPPRFEVEFDRDAQGDATLTLIITDPSGAITASPEFSKREGSQASDVWLPFSAVWDTEPSNPPYSGTWIEALVVPGGEEAGIRWRYSWTDEDGTTRTHGHTHYTARIDENQVELIFTADQGVPRGSAGNDYVMETGSRVRPFALNVFLAWIIPFALPLGVTIEEFEARLYRETSSDTCTCILNRSDIDGTGTARSTLTGSTGGWSTQSDTSVTEVVTADLSYHAVISLRGVVAANDAMFSWVRLVYDRQSQLQVY